MMAYPLESICKECRCPIIRDACYVRYCKPCAYERVKRRSREAYWNLFPKGKPKKTINEKTRKSYIKNRAARLEYQRKYNAEHKDEVRRKQKIWYQKMKREMISRRENEK